MKLSLKKEWSGAVRNLSDWLLPDTLFSLLTWLKLSQFRRSSSTIGRDEATRTPDPYVPNVVRYQLRYIPMAIG